jgi:hypothetical protein
MEVDAAVGVGVRVFEEQRVVHGHDERTVVARRERETRRVHERRLPPSRSVPFHPPLIERASWEREPAGVRDAGLGQRGRTVHRDDGLELHAFGRKTAQQGADVGTDPSRDLLEQLLGDQRDA